LRDVSNVPTSDIRQGRAKGREAAMEVLILVAEHNGPTMFARIGVMRALNRNVTVLMIVY
jgi:hypothetical protein